MILIYDMWDSHKNTPCVYCLYENEEVVYVGQTVNLQLRVKNHKSDGKTFSRYSCIPCKPSEMSDLEATLIVKHNPKYNWTLPSSKLFLSKSAAIKKLNAMCAELIDFLPVEYTAVQHNDNEQFRKETKFINSSRLDDLIDKVINDASKAAAKGENE